MPIIVVITLFGVMFMSMLLRVVLPVGQKAEGETIKQVYLPYRQRLLYHRTSIYLIGTVMILGGLGGWLSFAYQVVVVMIAFAIVGIRINYTFTTEGVILNNVVFRYWHEFKEVEGDANHLKLIGAGNFRPFKILLPARSSEEIGKLAMKLVKQGGKVESRPAPVGRTGGRPAKRRKVAS